jgi:hypothetical protein
MQKQSFISSLIVTWMLLMVFTTVVLALDDVSDMRCNGVIAEIGDQQYELQQKCGPPTATEENGQVWIYDRRPDGFVYTVTFADGQVERIQVGDGD